MSDENTVEAHVHIDFRGKDAEVSARVPPNRIVEMVGYLEHMKLQLLTDLDRRSRVAPRIVPAGRVPKVGPN